MKLWNTDTQKKNLAWFLPRPKPDRYKGGMPLYAEKWLLELAYELLGFRGEVLNLFCGMNMEGYRVDINPDVLPDLVGDAHKLTQFLDQSFDIILADPPYSNEEAKKLYNTPKLNYKKWTSQATQRLRPNGLLIVYHKFIVPNPDPDIYRVEKRVFIGNRVWHVPRVAIYFRKCDKI